MKMKDRSNCPRLVLLVHFIFTTCMLSMNMYTMDGNLMAFLVNYPFMLRYILISIKVIYIIDCHHHQ